MKQTQSIHRTILTLVLSALLMIALLTVVAIYNTAWHEVEELFDADLARSARVLHTLLAHEAEEEQEMNEHARRVIQELQSHQLGPQQLPVLFSILEETIRNNGKERLNLLSRASKAGHKYESKLVLLARYQNGNIMLASPDHPDFPTDVEGFFDYSDGDHQWRGFSLNPPGSALYVQVGERRDIRSELVVDITENTLKPALYAFPILALLIWMGVTRGLRPLAHVVREVEQRKPESLDAVPLNETPREIQPLILALNGLLHSVENALDKERRFTADAAHELRTPLAALKTHAQVARNSTDPAVTQQSLTHILCGVDRATHLLEQLLTLARADATRLASSSDRHPIDLHQIAVDILSQHADLAIQKNIDLGLDSQGSAMVQGDMASLSILLRNLVDNALRYTPEGGKVSVGIDQQNAHVILTVADNGPGVSAENRQKLFARFHRGQNSTATTEGSGLGLSIVQRIADIHDARIALKDTPEEASGLLVEITFP